MSKRTGKKQGRELGRLLRGDGLALSRRDFLTLTGFSFVAMTGAAYAGERKALARFLAVEGADPGRVLTYASTCRACPASCGLLVRTRDGRPIKLEGNPGHAISRGGLCPVGQASILGLYDRQRLARPRKGGRDASWAEVDADVRSRLDAIAAQGGAVRLLSHTVTSPTERAWISRLLARFPDARHVSYDALSVSAVLDAHLRTHGTRVLPHYRLERADVLVGIDADFLGTWLSPVAFTRAYREGRSLEGDPPRCSWHVQLESRLTVTGAKADLRRAIPPGEVGPVLTHLASRIASRAGAAWGAAGAGRCAVPAEELDRIADRLWQARGRSLVLCGSQDLEAQAVCNLLNQLLGNYGRTLDLAFPSLQAQGSDAALLGLRDELQQGKVAALFVLGCNPVYELPGDWAGLLKRVPISVACVERLDETAEAASHACPVPHFLAAWGDAEPVAGRFSLAQPTFPVLGEARPVLESLAAWSGQGGKARDLVQAHWREALFPRQGSPAGFQGFWDRALQDGYAELPGPAAAAGAFDASAVRPVPKARDAAAAFVLVLYPKAGLLDGSHAYNPWLQELPDPISKATWDNYVCIAPGAAGRLGLKDGDAIRVQVGTDALELPVLVQPGQDEGTLALALGYGSRLSERFAAVGPAWLQARPTLAEHGRVGRNAAPFLAWQDGLLANVRPGATLTKTGREFPLARTQVYHAIEVPKHLAPEGQARRPMVLETTVAGLLAGDPPAAHGGHADLWPDDHKTEGPRWGMVIDLNACTGCSACVVSCQVENNIPVVGKDEVRRNREMSWMRIDRYYEERGSEPGQVDVSFQPMLCHHCGNAPCETVCPVLATVHSSEGLNQQVYNRCVGTRYCANNCPYKVRRFNWFDYAHEDSLQNLVLNPDVTVRSRGVMEKCSFCIQRIQEAKLEARKLGKPIPEGALQTACQQSCPAQAIRFGDLKDPKGAVARAAAEGRSYQVLAELNVKPAVSYQRIVRNRPSRKGGGKHD